MARAERPLGNGDGPLIRFAADLRQLRIVAGSPPYRELARRAHYSAAALAEAASGRKLPSLAVTVAYVAACQGDVAAWERRWHDVAAAQAANVGVPRPIDSTAQAPYVGLAAFRTEDADLFFGRDRLVAQLSELVARQRCVMVVGPSGSGKSSLLRAGLLHHMRKEATSGPAIVMTPGSRPVEECAAHLANLLTDTTAADVYSALIEDPMGLHLAALRALESNPSDAELVLIVDQFEEIFTVGRDRDQTAQFLRLTDTAANAPASRIRIVLGVRADFYGRCAGLPELIGPLREAQLLVGPLSTEELQQVITQPAVNAGCRVETALVSRIVADASGQSGVLPLVSHALLETWRRRRGTTLTLAGYQAAGGIEHAIAWTAEQAYAALSDDQQQWVRTLFIGLVSLGEGTGDTKRRLQRAELEPDMDADTLERLVQARLVTLDQESIELTHEALIRCWPRLAAWLTEDREGLRVHRQLTEAASTWANLDQDPGALYRGSRLTQASQWASTTRCELSAREHAFLKASLAAQARERVMARRRTRRLRLFLATLSVLLLVTTAATVWAVQAQQATGRQRNNAIAQKALAQALELRANNPALALQLGLAASRIADLPEIRSGVLTMLASPYAARLTGERGAIQTLTFGAEGRILASSDSVGTVRLWDTATQRPHATLKVSEQSTFPSALAAISTDGRTLATRGVKSDGSVVVTLWDTVSLDHPRPLSVLTTSTDRIDGHSIALSPNGRLLAAGGTAPDGHGTLQLWDVTNREHPQAVADLARQTGPVTAMAISRNGRVLAAADSLTTDFPASTQYEIRLWDISDPAHASELGVVSGYHGFVQPVLSPDAHTLATAQGDDQSALVWDVSDPRQPRALTPISDSTDRVASLSYSPDGHTIAIGNSNGTLRLWDVTDTHRPQMLANVTGHTTPISAIAFSQDGRTVATGGGDGLIRLESVTPYVSAIRNHGPTLQVEFSPRGSILAVATYDGTIGLWDVHDPLNPKVLAMLPAHHAGMVVTSLAFSGDGRLLATIDQTNTLTVWDVDDPRTAGAGEPAVIAGPVWSQFPQALTFRPNSDILAVAANDRTVRLWDLTSPREPKDLATFDGPPGRYRPLAFTPNGEDLIVGGDNGNTELWDTTDLRHPQLIGNLAEPAQATTFMEYSLAVSHDNIMAVARSDQMIALWDLADVRHPRPLPALPSTSSVASVTFSADGHTLAAGSGGDLVALWDTSDIHHPVPSANLRSPAGSVTVTFNPDNQTLAAAGGDASAAPLFPQLWETTSTSAAAAICRLVSPPLTRAEWDQYFPDITYQAPCP